MPRIHPHPSEFITMDIEALRKAVIQSNRGLPVAKVLDYVISEHSGPGTVYLPTEISKACGDAPLVDIINSLNVLCDDPFNLINRQWFFRDEEIGNDWELEDADMADVIAHNEFVNPRTGQPVADYLDKLSVAYTSTAELDRHTAAPKKKIATRETLLSRLTAVHLGSLMADAMSPSTLATSFVSDLINARSRLEGSANFHRDTNEDGLTDALLAPLSPYDSYLVSNGNTNGHADFFLKYPITGNHIIVGEAKLHSTKGWSAYEYGLIKTVTKYARPSTIYGIIVYYYQDEDIESKMADYKKWITNKKTAYFHEFRSPDQVGLLASENLFVSMHDHRGKDLPVVHIWADLYSPTDELCVRRAKEHQPTA